MICPAVLRGNDLIQTYLVMLSGGIKNWWNLKKLMSSKRK